MDNRVYGRKEDSLTEADGFPRAPAVRSQIGFSPEFKFSVSQNERPAIANLTDDRKPPSGSKMPSLSGEARGRGDLRDRFRVYCHVVRRPGEVGKRQRTGRFSAHDSLASKMSTAAYLSLYQRTRLSDFSKLQKYHHDFDPILEAASDWHSRHPAFETFHVRTTIFAINPDTSLVLSIFPK